MKHRRNAHDVSYTLYTYTSDITTTFNTSVSAGCVHIQAIIWKLAVAEAGSIAPYSVNFVETFSVVDQL